MMESVPKETTEFPRGRSRFRLDRHTGGAKIKKHTKSSKLLLSAAVICISTSRTDSRCNFKNSIAAAYQMKKHENSGRWKDFVADQNSKSYEEKAWNFNHAPCNNINDGKPSAFLGLFTTPRSSRKKIRNPEHKNEDGVVHTYRHFSKAASKETTIYKDLEYENRWSDMPLVVSLRNVIYPFITYVEDMNWGQLSELKQQGEDTEDAATDKQSLEYKKWDSMVMIDGASVSMEGAVKRWIERRAEKNTGGLDKDKRTWPITFIGSDRVIT